MLFKANSTPHKRAAY